MSKLPTQDDAKKGGRSDKNAPEKDDAEPAGMTLWEHLEELRSRLIKMILAFLAGFGAAWFYKETVLGALIRPLKTAWPEASLHFSSPAALFLAYVRIAALAGFVFALPIMLYQVWAFVAPGLYSREKRYAIPFVVSSCGLFAGGGYFGWKVAFPLAFKFLIVGFQGVVGGVKIEATIMIGDYIDFVMRMLLAFGLAAELPVLVFFLAVAGLVTHKQMIKFFRYFLVIDFVVAAIVTPPDVMSQLLLAIPLAILYVLSIGVAYIFQRKPPPPD
ncbi:MAG TPA: twin-arginine translocase subunit TatC, partial [Polyangiaceae bacterium]